MNFPLSPDLTHQTETFGPLFGYLDGTTYEQRMQVNQPKELTLVPMETDPTGRDPHAPGAKLDAGKCRPSLVLGGFARALWAVSMVGTYGAVKYTEDGWVSVPNGQSRYDDAGLRHWLKEKMGEPVDPDTELDHAAHYAWNALAKLDLMIRARESKA